MDSIDDDMFSFSDEDQSPTTYKANPVSEHLTRQLVDVEDRVEKAKNEIVDVRDTASRILKKLLATAIYGEEMSSDSDSDLYTIEGEPIVKKKRQEERSYVQPLVVKGRWQRVIDNKWIVGVLLENTTRQTLYSPVFYLSVTGADELHGTSMFWHLEDDTFWQRTGEIGPNRETIVATAVLDLPDFGRCSSAGFRGTIAYEIDDRELQTPVAGDQLRAADTVDGACSLNFAEGAELDVLALKSVSVERTVCIPLQNGRGSRLLEFLDEKAFGDVYEDVYMISAPGALAHCLAEVLPIVGGTARLRISARSTLQLNAILRLFRDEFPDMDVEGERDNATAAAEALLEELQLSLEDNNPAEAQRARIKTDLLVP